MAGVCSLFLLLNLLLILLWRIPLRRQVSGRFVDLEAPVSYRAGGGSAMAAPEGGGTAWGARSAPLKCIDLAPPLSLSNRRAAAAAAAFR